MNTKPPKPLPDYCAFPTAIINFTPPELCRSREGERKGLDNIPTPEQARNLVVVGFGLETIRRAIGDRMVLVNSGFRNDEVNAEVGGGAGSYHTLGLAADIEVPGMSNIDVARVCAKNPEIDKVILEHYINGRPRSGWVHLQWAKDGEQPRREFYLKESAVPGYTRVEDDFTTAWGAKPKPRLWRKTALIKAERWDGTEAGYDTLVRFFWPDVKSPPISMITDDGVLRLQLQQPGRTPAYEVANSGDYIAFNPPTDTVDGWFYVIPGAQFPLLYAAARAGDMDRG